MIIVRLMGGLGNQMFQYALGRRLAYDASRSLKLDLYGLSIDPRRNYRLHHLSIAAQIASPAEVRRAWRFIHYKPRGLRRYILGLLKGLGLYPNWQLIQERHYHFDQSILQQTGNLYLQGYWQSPRYFEGIASIIRREFRVSALPSAENERWAQRIVSTNAVSIHIRRGDYIADPKTTQYHGTLNPGYYHTAASKIADQVPSPHFFIFSDDPAWAKENLDFGYPATIFDHNSVDEEYEDLRLMYLCKHHIIANSSFSWWGAWLADYPDKIVFAPKNWFNQAQNDTSDLIPPNWNRI